MTQHDTGPAGDRPAHRFLWIGVALNLPFLLCHPAWTAISAGLVRSLAINAVLFIVPGVPLVALCQRANRPARWHLLWVIAASLVAFVGSVGLTHALGWPVDSGATWNLTWAGTNVAWLTAWALGCGFPALGTVPYGRSVFAPAFALCYLLFFWGATVVVPHQGDHDMDLQGTAHALLTEFKPGYPTSRSYYYLAHPPLLHVYVAGSFLYHGQLDGVAAYNPNSTSALPPDDHWQHYLGHPFFIETRTPNLFLSSMTAALLAMWLARVMRSAPYGLVLALMYATLPEVFVRSSYGGYFAGSKFFAVQMLLAVEAWSRETTGGARGRVALAGAMAAVANHKLVLLPLAIGIWRLFSVPLRQGWQKAAGHLLHPVLVGFLLGTLGFWTYGWWVSPTDFWNDHIRHHIVDRVMNHNARGLNMSAYPTLPGLWLEFWRDTSYLLLPLGLVSLGLLLRRRPDSTASSDLVTGWRGFAGLWTIWTMVATVAFSLIDWKQTKHLTTLIVPMTLAPAAAVGARRLSPRVAFGVALAIIGLNLLTIVSLAEDFRSLVKIPEW